MTRRRALLVGLLLAPVLLGAIVSQLFTGAEPTISRDTAISIAIAHLATMRPGQQYVVIQAFRIPNEDDPSLNGGRVRFSASQSVVLLAISSRTYRPAPCRSRTVCGARVGTGGQIDREASRWPGASSTLRHPCFDTRPGTWLPRTRPRSRSPLAASPHSRHAPAHAFDRP
jgi:hypothetical protein